MYTKKGALTSKMPKETIIKFVMTSLLWSFHENYEKLVEVKIPIPGKAIKKQDHAVFQR